VLHLINGESYAGAERVQDLLGEGLPKEGFDVTLGCLKPRDFPRQRSSTCELRSFEMRGRFDLRPAWPIARLLRREHYALVHSHTPRAALIGRTACALSGHPLVHHVHSPTSRDTEQPWRNRINAAVEDYGMRAARCLIPVSASLIDYLADRGLGAKRTRLIANGVPVQGPLVKRSPPASEWVVGCMALFRPRKGLDVLVDAVARLCSLGRPVRLRVVGAFESPDMEQAIHAQVDRLGLGDRVDWRGFANDVQAELACMDVFALPSLYGEGMPMVLLEAMSAGIPVVASAVEGIPEALDQGRCGTLVPPGDSEALASALDELMKNPAQWQQSRLLAHERQALHYSDQSMARGVAEVYREVLAL
jgi:glycosyltransferase involved in cell wall biosynthesis